MAPVYVNVVQRDWEEEGSFTAASSGAETQETDWRTTGEECERHQRTGGCPGNTWVAAVVVVVVVIVIGGEGEQDEEEKRKSYRESPAIWDHSVLPATRCRWMCLSLTLARQAGGVA